MVFRMTGLVILLALGLLVPARAQVPPGDINDKLLSKSIKSVLGDVSSPEWTAISLQGLSAAELDLKQIQSLPDTLYLGRVATDKGRRWILPDFAPSKSEIFSFVIYLDEHREIVDVDVLDYRESYGYEIDYPFFRAQFHEKSSPDEVQFGRTVQNISGATISARSITYAVHDLLAILTHIKPEL